MRNFGRWFGAQAKISIFVWLSAGGCFPGSHFGLLGWLSERVVNPADMEGVYPYFFALFVYGYIILLLSIRSALRYFAAKVILLFNRHNFGQSVPAHADCTDIARSVRQLNKSIRCCNTSA